MIGREIYRLEDAVSARLVSGVRACSSVLLVLVLQYCNIDKYCNIVLQYCNIAILQYCNIGNIAIVVCLSDFLPAAASSSSHKSADQSPLCSAAHTDTVHCSMAAALRAFATATLAVLAAARHVEAAALTVGVVRYSDDVQQIWADLQAALCEDHRVCFAVRLFDAYAELEDALFDGSVGIAWNGPVAHVRCERRARQQGDRLVSLGMRDSDVGFEALIVSITAPVPADSSVATARAAIEAAAHVRGFALCWWWWWCGPTD